MDSEMKAPFVARCASVLATGYILFFFSETMFWSDPGRVPLGEMVLTWLVYSLLAFVFLDLCARFRARDVWSVFLAGAVVGWLAEGAIVQTVYEALPFSISWTGLAWHALISVVVGVYLLSRAIEERRTVRVATLSAALGAFWGLWAIWAWVAEGRVASVLAFAVHVFVTSLPLVAAFVVRDRWGRAPFRPSRVAEVLVGLVFVAAFVATVMIVPIAIVVLPPLLVLALAGLRWNRTGAPQGPREEPGAVGTPWRGAAPLMLIPAVASAIYALASVLHLRVQTGWVVYAVTTVAGVWYFVHALRHTHRARRANAPA